MACSMERRPAAFSERSCFCMSSPWATDHRCCLVKACYQQTSGDGQETIRVRLLPVHSFLMVNLIFIHAQLPLSVVG